jgi:hypothetical protein
VLTIIGEYCSHRIKFHQIGEAARDSFCTIFNKLAHKKATLVSLLIMLIKKPKK